MDNYRLIIDAFLNHKSPLVRYKVRNRVLDEAKDSASLKALQAVIRKSPLVEDLQSERDHTGRIPRDPYEKWRGAHRVLTMLAELDYPRGDPNCHFYPFKLRLKVVGDNGCLSDPRCRPALKLLVEKSLPEDCWRVEKKDYHNNPSNKYRLSLVPWNENNRGT